MGAWWDEEKTLWLVTPEEFERLPDGFMLTCIDGEIVTKGKDHIDMDTRVGHIAYGITKEAVDAALNMEREMSDDMIFDCFTCDAVDKISEQETEITRLRADLAAVTEERDMLREALKPFVRRLEVLEETIVHKYAIGTDIDVIHLRAARAAIEGVTEKEGEGNE